MGTRVYLVLGATGGLGTALCRRLAARDERIVAVARDADRLAGLAAEASATTIAGDARDADVVAGAVERALEEHGRLDGAACLVGSIVLGPAHATKPETVEEVWRQNLVPAFHLVRAAAPAMGKQEHGGSIVLTSSAAARIGLPNHEAIAAAKGAVEGLARSAAATYAPRGVRVNCVAPGLMRTAMSERLISTPASLAASEAMHALGRVGEPEEVATLVEWLLGPDGTWATGQTYAVDGGLAGVAPPFRRQP